MLMLAWRVQHQKKSDTRDPVRIKITFKPRGHLNLDLPGLSYHYTPFQNIFGTPQYCNNSISSSPPSEFGSGEGVFIGLSSIIVFQFLR